MAMDIICCFNVPFLRKDYVLPCILLNSLGRISNPHISEDPTGKKKQTEVQAWMEDSKYCTRKCLRKTCFCAKCRKGGRGLSQMSQRGMANIYLWKKLGPHPIKGEVAGLQLGTSTTSRVSLCLQFPLTC